MRFGLILFFVLLLVSNAIYVFSSDLQEIVRMKQIKQISREVETLIKEKKYTLARTKVEEGFKIAPKAFDLFVLSGKLFYLNGDIVSSYTEFQKALKINPEDTYVLSWLSKINIQDGKFHTEHFTYFLVPESKKWIMKLPFEEKLGSIAAILDVSLRERISLYFYENENDFFNEYGTNHLYKKGKLLGVAQIQKNRILINSIVKESEMLSVVMHELVHFLIHKKMKDSRLYGIEEGLANYMGNRRANYRALKASPSLNRAIPAAYESHENYDPKINFEAMIFYKFKNPHDWEENTLLYYELSTALIEFIHTHGGDPLLKQYINDLMRTDTNYYRFTWSSLGFPSKNEFEIKFLRFINHNIEKI